MTLRKGIVIVGLVLLVAAAAGAVYWQRGQSAPPDGQLRLYGNVDVRQVLLAFNQAERIADMRVFEGDRVRKGQILATLETARLANAVERARANVAAQRAALQALEKGARPEEIAKARADVDAAQARLRNARITYERVKNLEARNVASRQQMDDATAALNTAKAQLEASQAALALTLAGPRQEEIAGARAVLQAREHELALARLNLADARLVTPTDAVVQNRIAEPGDMASPGVPVYTLAVTNPVWVRAYVGEPKLGRLRLGMPAQVSTDSFPDKPLPGWVGYVSPTAEFTPSTVQTTETRSDLVYQVRIYVCNPRGELHLGMPATVQVSLQPPVARTDTGAGASGTTGAGTGPEKPPGADRCEAGP